ncbi:MAG TPA: VWA domain-containing protein, partial [Pyrinomonadaceae bacterium]
MAAQAATGFAQDASDEPIRIDTSVVSLDVLVVDKQTGASIDGLRREDFTVTDDGRPQTLAFFSQGADARLPLALVLLLDVSHPQMPDKQVLRMRAAVRRAIWETLESGAQVALVNLSPDYEIVKPLGHDPQTILELITPTEGFRKADAGRTKRTSELDIGGALLSAVRHAQERQRQSRVELVVISEKLYAGRRQAASGAVTKLLASGAVVHAIRSPKRGDDLLGALCEQTG